ncbi:hypothetical protein J4482_00485 [Candidatus Woesearchaeota archaeon]|nr:hypothetical protein [Candidatus Woesearchaeota archaeon]
MNKKTIIIIFLIVITISIGLYSYVNLQKNIGDLGTSLELLRSEQKFEESWKICSKANRPMPIISLFVSVNEVPCICRVTEIGLRLSNNRKISLTENRTLTKNELLQIKNICDELSSNSYGTDCAIKMNPACDEFYKQYETAK